MGISFQAPQQMSGSGNYVDQPGKFMFVVTGIDEAPKGCVGGWAIEAMVKAAPKEHENQVGRHVTLKFWPTKGDEKDGGEFNNRKWARAALALGWITPESVKAGGGFQVEDTSSARGRLFFAEIEKQPKNPQFMELAYANIFHVDDPGAKDYPRRDDMIAMVPEAFRCKPEQFNFDKSSQSKDNSGGGEQGVDIDEL